MKLTTCTDSELIHYATNRNLKKGMEEVYRRTVDDVYRFVYSRCGSKEIAEDIVSETYLTLFGILDRFDGGSKLQTFIIGIALNKIKQFVNNSDLALNEELIIVDDFSDDEIKVISNNLTNILNELPEKYRKVLELIFLESNSTADTAKKLNTTESNVRKMKSRALAMAKEISVKYQNHE